MSVLVISHEAASLGLMSVRVSMFSKNFTLYSLITSREWMAPRRPSRLISTGRSFSTEAMIDCLATPLSLASIGKDAPSSHAVASHSRFSWCLSFTWRSFLACDISGPERLNFARKVSA